SFPTRRSSDLIVLLLLTNTLALVHIYMLTAFMGLLSTFYGPAVRGIIPQIVEKEQLLSANSLRSIAREVNGMIGPVIGGFVVASFGLYLAYSINTVTFLVSALFVSFITVQTTVPSDRVMKQEKP